MMDISSFLTGDEEAFDLLLTFGVLIAFVLYSVVLGFRSVRRLQKGAAKLAAVETKAGEISAALANQIRGEGATVFRDNEAVQAAPPSLRRDLILYLGGLIHQLSAQEPDVTGTKAVTGTENVSVASAHQVLRDEIVDECLQLEQASRLATHFVALSFALSVLLIAISLQVASANSAPGAGQADVLTFVGLKFLVTLAGLIAAGTIRTASERFGDRAARSLDALRTALDEDFAPINATAQALLDTRERAQKFDAEMTAIKALQTTQQKALEASLEEEKAVHAIQTEVLALQQKVASEAELERTSREALKSAVDQFVAATEKLRKAIDEELENRIRTLGERVVAMGEAIQTSGSTFETRVNGAANKFKNDVDTTAVNFGAKMTSAANSVDKTLGEASSNFYTNMTGNQQAFAEAIEGRMSAAGIAYADKVGRKAEALTQRLAQTSDEIQQSWNTYLGLGADIQRAQPIGPAVLRQIETSFGALAEAASGLAASVRKVDEFQSEKPDMEQLVREIQSAANKLRSAHTEMGPTVARLEHVTTLAAKQPIHGRETRADGDTGTQSRDTDPRNTAHDNADRPSDRKHSDDV